MCTLAILLRPGSPHPLVVAANRDEALDRPSRPPALWPGRPALVAGRDERAGGTWMGVHEAGLFVGLTNLWEGRPPDPARRSRGEVVLELLRAGHLEAVERVLRGRDPTSTNPFLVVCADREGRGLWTTTALGLRPRALAPGLRVFGNRPPERPDPGLRGAEHDFRRAWAARRGDRPRDLVEALRIPLRRHRGAAGPTESVCVHAGDRFGTVSSSIWILGPRWEESQLHHADGPPCRTDHRWLREPLAALAALEEEGLRGPGSSRSDASPSPRSPSGP